jgi:hypothetical protein
VAIAEVPSPVPRSRLNLFSYRVDDIKNRLQVEGEIRLRLACHELLFNALEPQERHVFHAELQEQRERQLRRSTPPREGHRKHGAAADGDLGRIAEMLATHSQRRDIMPIVMRRATCLSHHGGAESRRANVMRSVLIGTVILVANLGPGPVVITNATLARNSAGGIFGGGGIANLGSGTVELQNTILALNTAPGVLGPDCFGRLISRGHNLLGDTADCTPPRCMRTSPSRHNH